MAVIASAPGKVLLTGGYLILERPNAGLVLTTSARFYAIVKPLYEELKPESWAWAWADVKVTSPQLMRESFYKLSVKNLTLQPVSLSESKNPFVEHAVQYAVAAAHATLDDHKKDAFQKLLLRGLDITIIGSNDFYSYRNQIEAQGLTLTQESLASLPPFTSITFNTEGLNGESCKPEVAKTGLGSSAAMTTAVVAALLHYLGVLDLNILLRDQPEFAKDAKELDMIHVIAQSAHCIAQGKVGSGFDVSSAVYGSLRYVRFSPEVLSSAQAFANVLPLPEIVSSILKAKWDHERTEFSLPPFMNLLLGEPGSGGSSTPSMVGAVKKWQKSDPINSQETWRKLSEANSELEKQLSKLSKVAEENQAAYMSVIKSCSTLKSDKWTEQAREPTTEVVVNALLGAKEAMLRIRNHMKLMGQAAGVPIEPDSQTQLLDTTMSMEGVLLAGVPGAGGFDAIFAVTLGDDARNNITKTWSSLNILPMLVSEDPNGIVLETCDPRSQSVTSAVSSMLIK